jgi:parvulin-like peptidyl-prolyl isomerase
MNIKFLSITALMCVAGFVPLGSAAEIVDEIVATVDNEAILLSSIRAEIQPALIELREIAIRDGLPQEEYSQREEAIIRQSIDQNIEMNILYRKALLQLQVSGASEDRVNEQIDESIEDMRSQFSSNEEFMDSIEAEGQTIADIRAQQKKLLLARDMARGKMNALRTEVVISNADVNSYYEEHKDEYSFGALVSVRQIFLSASSADEHATAQLENIREELDAGADFAELAQAHSELFPENGGSMGWIKPDSFDPKIASVIDNLHVGEVSEVVETQFGIHLITVDERREGGVSTLDDVRLGIEPRLRALEAEKRHKRWLADLRRSSRVRVFL